VEFPSDPGLVWPSPRTFFGAPRCDDLSELAADVAFLGVPYDAGTLQPYIRTGQSGGPTLARAASFNQLDYSWPPTARPEGGSLGWFDIESGRDHLVGVTMADCGDVGITGAQIDENLERITEVSRTIAERSLVVAVGGDHSISFPVGRGMERFAPIDVVHFDAHADFVDHFFGARFSHGSQLRRLSELPFVRSITAIGLRNVFREEYEDLRSYGAGIATSLEVLDDGPAQVIERLVPAGGNLYVSIDIDVLDLPIVPGTTLPEPGGITYRDLRSLLHHTAQRGRVVGFDIVELDAPHDVSGATSRVTTWVMVHFLSSIFDAR
jgi:agmatinase